MVMQRKTKQRDAIMAIMADETDFRLLNRCTLPWR